MLVRRLFTVVAFPVVGFAAVLLAGCSAPVTKRPTIGDRVTPELTLVEPWPAGGLAQVMLRLQVLGPKEDQPAFLQFEDVPADANLTATVNFWNGDAEIKRSDDLAFVPDC